MTAAEFEDATGIPLVAMAGQCHVAALALVRSRILGESRVARGTCAGVGSQHSWVVLGGDVYRPRVEIVDPTLWSYDESVDGIWRGLADERPHVPHGSGSIWTYGRPASGDGEPIELDVDWSGAARDFLDLLGPLDRRGWSQLAHAPVDGWPSAEIIGAMHDDDRLSALLPIDVVGNLTDRNPGGLYLADPEAVR